jgi:hypothetical protein
VALQNAPHYKIGKHAKSAHHSSSVPKPRPSNTKKWSRLLIAWLGCNSGPLCCNVGLLAKEWRRDGDARTAPPLPLLWRGAAAPSLLLVPIAVSRNVPLDKTMLRFDLIYI